MKVFHFLFTLGFSIGIILMPSNAFSKSTNDRASIKISKDTMTIDETLIVEIKSEADEKIEILGEDFSIVSRSISSQIIVKKTGVEKSDQNLFHLKPNSTGKQKEIHVQIGDKLYGPFFIDVSSGVTQANSSKQAKGDFAEIFIKEKKLYVNQPAEISIIAYTKRPIIDSSIERKRLSHEGLHLKPIFIKNTKDVLTNINGVSFRKKVLEKFIVYPLYAGKHIISGAEVILLLGQSHFFDLQKARKKISLPELTLSAIPLPTEEKPEDFLNNYGDYTFSLKWNKVEAPVGQPIALSIKANGRGNLETLNFPKLLPITNALQVGEPLVENNFFFNGTTYQGTKTANYSLLFHQAGEVQVEPLLFSSFDSEKGYVTQTISPGKVTILSTAANQLAPPSDDIQKELLQDLKILESDLSRQPQENLDWEKNFLYYHLAAFLIMLLTPFFLILSKQIKKRNLATKVALQKLYRVKNAFFEILQQDEVDLKKNDEGKKMLLELKNILKNFLALRYQVDPKKNKKTARFEKEKLHMEKIAAALKHYEELLLSENEKIFSPKKEVENLFLLLQHRHQKSVNAEKHDQVANTPLKTL